MKKIVIICFLIIGWIIPFSSQASSERIMEWNSNIIIQPDSTMIVTETIKVYASGDQIKRGIYRDFPTKYKDKNGNDYLVGFEVMDILRDGKKEPYHLEKQSNGQRVYIGEKNVLLKTGEYTYTITYKTDHQLGFFDDHDELYWNVTGNGWNFVIEKVTVNVQLPNEVDIISLDGYTGRQGSKDQNFISSIRENTAFFTTSKILQSKEGFTVVVVWSKGFIIKPVLLVDNKKIVNNVFYIIFLAIILLYYYVIWKKVGDDPEKGTIIAQYTPPFNMSPSMMRYLIKMDYDDNVMTATLVNLAVKGAILIKEDKSFKLFNPKFTLIKNQNQQTIDNLSIEEKIVFDELFKYDNVVELANKKYILIKHSIEILKKSLQEHTGNFFFIKNKKYYNLGLVISFIFVVMVVQLNISNVFYQINGESLNVYFLIVLFFLCLSFINLFLQKLWKDAVKNLYNLFVSCLSIFFILLTFGGLFFGNHKERLMTNEFYLFLFCIFLINLIFNYLLKSSTVTGRKILDQIEGFKLFLEVTEKDRLNFFNPPEKTAELFEKYLPYALALGVENKWAEQFSGVFSNIDDYQPSWYSGRHMVNFSSFSSSFGNSFSSAVSSASTPPGSSSGRGGFSGGGGGGGGGGGW